MLGAGPEWQERVLLMPRVYKNQNGWNEYSGNWWMGCSQVGKPGFSACDNCTAMIRDHIRFKRAGWGPHAPRVRVAGAFATFAKINRDAARLGIRVAVFINSGSDFFDRFADPEWRAAAWPFMRDCRNILWMILSKRPGNMARMLPSDWGDGYENCWLGVTVETQHETRRFASLLRVPSVRYWCSGEPLLEAVDFSPWLGPDKISWLIIGGETHNSHPRPLDPAWCYDLHEQCDRAGAMVWQKQMHGRSQADAKAKIPADLIRLERPPLV